MTLEELRQRLATLTGELRALHEAAGDRDMTEDETTAFDSKRAEIEAVKGQIRRAEEIEGLERDLDVPETRAERPTPSTPEQNAQRSRVEVGEERETQQPFRNLSEQLACIRSAGFPNAGIDKRLLPLASERAASGANITVGSEGGFLIHPTFAAGVMESAVEHSGILDLVDKYTIPEGSNSVEFVSLDETSVASTIAGGVQVYRTAEAASASDTKPKFKVDRLQLEKMVGVFYSTEELSAASGGLAEQMAARNFPIAIARKLDSEIFSGTGAGECLGILNSPALVSVAKETGQDADTIEALNVIKMRARMQNSNLRSARWFCNPDCMTQFPQMYISAGTTGQLIWMPATGLKDDPWDKLLGKPIIPTDQCEALGDKGDILLVDPSEYLLVMRGESAQMAISIHVRFLYGENTYRWTMFVNGMPKKSSALTIKNSSDTRSFAVALNARA